MPNSIPKDRQMNLFKSVANRGKHSAFSNTINIKALPSFEMYSDMSMFCTPNAEI